MYDIIHIRGFSTDNDSLDISWIKSILSITQLTITYFRKSFEANYRKFIRSQPLWFVCPGKRFTCRNLVIQLLKQVSHPRICLQYFCKYLNLIYLYMRVYWKSYLIINNRIVFLDLESISYHLHRYAESLIFVL